jgi:5,5'-dehydrodivanillate O-demethylase
MLTAEENKLLTQVGPGTPGGEFHRRYWHPVAVASDLLKHPVKKVRILGEDLVLHRNLKGGYGLTADKCPHRQVSLEYGFPTEEGIRCPYHGWMFNEKGQCLETPLEPKGSKLASRVCIKSYPTQELGGLIFAYLGPLPAPEINRWDLLVWPNAIRQIGSFMVKCNWLQGVENSLDSRHNEYLHGHYFKWLLQREGETQEFGRADLEAKFPYTKQETTRGEYGFISTIERAISPPYNLPYRGIHTYLVFPYFSRQGGKRVRSHLLWRVPIDDETHWHIEYEVFIPPPGFEVPKQEHVFHHIIPTQNEKGEWLCTDNIAAQDAMVWEAQGAITDRTAETLGSSDAGIVMFRRVLKEQILGVAKGQTPFNVHFEKKEMLELEPKLGNFDVEMLWEAKVGYGKYYPGKRGAIMPEALKLLEKIAKSEELKRMADEESAKAKELKKELKKEPV